VRLALRVGLAALCIALLALWDRPDGARDPLARLARALTEKPTARELARALDGLRRDSWTVEELGSPWPDLRTFRVSSARKAGPAPLLGLASIRTRPARTVATLALEPGADAARSRALSEDLVRRADALFEMPEAKGGRFVAPSVPEFLRRLQDGAAVPPRASWQIGPPAPGGAVYVDSDPAEEALGKEGFSLIAVRSENGALAAFATDLVKGVAAGAAVPTPRAASRPSDWSASFQTERRLTAGEASLSTALEKVAKGAGSVRVSGGGARLVSVLDGPGAGEFTAVFEALPERVLLCAVVGARDAELLARLPLAGSGEVTSASAGDLSWSGWLAPPAEVPYVGVVPALSNAAFEWRPLGS
jgi:hypothetical protein